MFIPTAAQHNEALSYLRREKNWGSWEFEYYFGLVKYYENIHCQISVPLKSKEKISWLTEKTDSHFPIINNCHCDRCKKVWS